jgi:hypothetical protein
MSTPTPSTSSGQPSGEAGQPANTSGETPTTPATPTTAAESTETTRGLYGLIVVLAGLLVTLGAFGLALLAFSGSENVSAALAPITGLIGTIVGAYFGVQTGASGKAHAEEARTKAEDDAKKLAAVAPAAEAKAILGVPAT